MNDATPSQSRFLWNLHRNAAPPERCPPCYRWSVRKTMLFWVWFLICFCKLDEMVRVMSGEAHTWSKWSARVPEAVGPILTKYSLKKQRNKRCNIPCWRLSKKRNNQQKFFTFDLSKIFSFLFLCVFHLIFTFLYLLFYVYVYFYLFSFHFYLWFILVLFCIIV